MKKLRFFGLLVTVVLLAFGLSVGCNNDTTTTGGESDPVVYRGTSNGRAIEITFDTAPIPGRARATEPRPGDNYLITIGGQTASSGWIELQEGGLILFHDTTGKGDFYGQLSGQTVIVQVPGEPASLTAGLVGGSGTYNPGGGGPGGNVGGGTGTPGTTPGPVAVPGEYSLRTPAATEDDVTAIVLTSVDYIILDENGNGSLQLTGRAFPSNVSTTKITDWEIKTGTKAALSYAAEIQIDGDAEGDNSHGPNGLLTIKGGTTANDADTITVTATVKDGEPSTSGDYTEDLTITIYQNETVPPPRVTLVNGIEGAAGYQYIAGVSAVKFEAPGNTTIRYILNDNAAAGPFAAATASSQGVVYTNEVLVSSSQVNALHVAAIAIDRTTGKISPLTAVAVNFTKAQVPTPVITLNDGDDDGSGGPGFILAQGGAKASTFTITAVPGAVIRYTTSTLSPAADAGAPNTASALYTGPVTITSDMLNAGNFNVRAIATIAGYTDSTAADTKTDLADLTQAKVLDPVIVISAGGVAQTESATGTNASDTFHLNTTNPSMMSITTPTRGASVFYIASVDAAPSAGTKTALDALWTNSATTNLRHAWTTPVNVIGGSGGIPLFEAGAPVALTSTNVQVRAYATKPGYLHSTSTGLDAGNLPAAKTLALATVVAPTWIRNPNTGKLTSETGGAAVSVTSRADWTDYRYLEIYSATPGALVPYTITPSGPAGVTAITVTPTTAPAGNITYVDLTATNVMTAIDALTQGQTLTLSLTAAASTKAGYKNSANPGAVPALVFTKDYSDN